MDAQWWDVYAREVARTFRGEAWTTSSQAYRKHGVRHVSPDGEDGISSSHTRIATGRNSGFAAVSLAIMLGARRIVLLGYDAGRTNGATHWHGDHPAGLGNGGDVRYRLWISKFETLAHAAAQRGITIINASRETAIAAFARAPLEQALDHEEAAAA